MKKRKKLKRNGAWTRNVQHSRKSHSYYLFDHFSLRQQK